MESQLVIDSLEENNFSSDTHSIEIISFDSKDIEQKKYPIPHRYYKNQLVLLPVNSKKFYLYWEFIDNFLQQYNLESATQIILKVVDSESNILKEIDCLGEVGEYFVHNLQYNTKIKVLAGFYKDGKFVEIICSNKIGSFNTEINFSEDDKLIYLKKEKGFGEIIRSSLEHITHGNSSSTYLREIERLKEVSTLSKDTLSSHTLREI